jgi:two-component system chemotaxis response regulator CheY
MRILVADDSATIRRLVAGILRLRRYEIVEAADGQEALTRLMEAPPCQVAILDVNMPHLDGFQVARSIRQTPELADLAVVVLTTEPSAGETALAAGADRFMLKPFQPQELLRVVAELLENSAQHTAHSAQPDEAMEPRLGREAHSDEGRAPGSS